MNEWLYIVENLSTEEKEEIYKAYGCKVSDEKIASDVTEYFGDFVGSENENCFGESVPDEGYTKNNLMWALGMY